MKIGYFIQNYKKGGVNTFIKNLVSKNIFKDEIIVITNHNNPGVNFLKKKNKNITFLEYSIFSWDKIFNMNLNNLIFLFSKIIYSVFFPISFIYQFIRLFFFFKKNKFDKIMIVNGGYPGGDLCIAAALAWNKINPNKRPWMNFHNFALKKYKFFLLNFYKNYIDIILAKSVMGFVSVSKICTNSIKQRKNLKNVKTSTIYNGHIFSKSTKNFLLKKKFNLPKNSKILLMLAEYDLRKGHKYIIKAMENIILFNKNIYLFIYGYGNQNHIKELVDNSKASKNIFLNDYEENNISLIKECDALVVPSQEFESFGYTVIEAMSQKKPIVATNCGGLPEIIDNNSNGYLVDKNRPNVFSKKILKLMDDKKIQNKFSKNSYNIYRKRFTNIYMIKNYNNLIKYNKIVN
tara:strand:+ start:1507 stop:2718 length:1212 start_codon:yes stop_codon:yes gene_type:complete